MAKLIQISNDAESTWDDLPGSQGSFSVEGEVIDDTILGQTFKSGLTGLVSWTVESDGIFKGNAGYLAELKKQGTPTVTTGLAMTIVSGKLYDTDDVTKDIWDRSAAVIIYDGGVDHTSDVIDIDYLFGRVTFDPGYTVTGAVTADVEYLPTVVIGKGNAYTLTMTADTIDNSDFPTVQANSGTKTFEPGLRTVTFEQQGIFDATESAKTDLTDRTELIIEIDPVGDGSAIARGFFRLSNTGQSGAVGALEDETISFVLNVPSQAKLTTVFNWRFIATTLSDSIQSALTSWLTELSTYDVRYMPSGAIGESPNDAIKGNFVVADISLSGGLNNMNVFNMSLQGTGVFTVV